MSARVSVPRVKSLGGHFACLCGGFEFYEAENFFLVIIFQKENRNNFTLSTIFIVKSLQKEQNSTNLLLWAPICRNKSAITPKWFNSLDTNSRIRCKIFAFRLYRSKCNFTKFPSQTIMSQFVSIFIFGAPYLGTIDSLSWKTLAQVPAEAISTSHGLRLK